MSAIRSAHQTETATFLQKIIHMAYLLGPCGGIGGEPRDMLTDSGNRILKVEVRHGDAIVAIRIHYQQAGGDDPVWTDWWGGEGGESDDVAMNTDEFLTGINGFYGRYEYNTVVRSLTFTSNKRTYGPYGKEEGVKFNLQAPTKIVAFTARSGRFLDAIGIY